MEYYVGFRSFSVQRKAVIKSCTEGLSEIKIQGLLWAGLGTGGGADCVSAHCGFESF